MPLITWCKGSFLLLARYLCSAVLFVASGASAVHGDWKDEIGYTRLVEEHGGSLERGVGVLVAIAEAFVGNNYLPDVNNSQFSGKNFTDASGIPSGISGHATSVTSRFVGNTASISPGVTNITLYQADDWIGRVLGYDSGADPAAQEFHIQNNSWIGTFSDKSIPTNVLQRVDYVVDRDDVLMLGGSSNSGGGAVPDLLGHGYNSLIVGRTDGSHGAGTTTFNGSGRIKPDLVAPATSTSLATPTVASAAALLREKGAGTDAVRSETMRAILMAGATKDEFPGWDRTTTRPLDDRFGAGELNVYNSYQILEGGEFAASTAEPSFAVGLSGWSYVGEITPAETLFYNFQVDSGWELDALSISLNWNLKVVDLDPSAANFIPSASLVNLDMRLFDSSSTFLGSLVDASLSPVDNVEYLYLRGLSAGTYTLQINGNGTTDFGLGWHGRLTAVPEPTSLVALTAGAFGIAAWRRCRRRGMKIRGSRLPARDPHGIR